MNTVATVEEQAKPIDVFRHQLDAMANQFAKALPAHIPVERFARVVMTAVQNNPKLLACTKQSLWNACMRAAQDGLLPDGREGAIVPYGENEDGKRGSDIAQWMPMILGIRKKARNSGEISTWEAHVVYEKDEFAFELGDEPFIRHAPALGDRGKIIAVYSIATLKDGSKSREVMSIEEIEKIRGKSKAKKGPWSDPVFYPEMCRKTVARRHAKVLPASTDLDDLLRRDDALYDLEGAREEAQRDRPKSLTSKLDLIAGGTSAPNPSQDPGDDQPKEIEGEVVAGAADADEKQGEAPTLLPAKESEGLRVGLIKQIERCQSKEQIDGLVKRLAQSVATMQEKDREAVQDAWNKRADEISPPQREDDDFDPTKDM